MPSGVKTDRSRIRQLVRGGTYRPSSAPQLGLVHRARTHHRAHTVHGPHGPMRCPNNQGEAYGHHHGSGVFVYFRVLEPASRGRARTAPVLPATAALSCCMCMPPLAPHYKRIQIMIRMYIQTHSNTKHSTWALPPTQHDQLGTCRQARRRAVLKPRSPKDGFTVSPIKQPTA